LVCGPLSDGDAANTEQSILLLIHSHVPSGMTDAFHATLRARPGLWDAEWYWGSSFPSGHTLEGAAFATSAVVCIGRIGPHKRGVAAAAVALSRLVLGAHWLSDVAAPTGIGTCLPLAMMFGRRLFLRGQEPDSRSKMEPQP
jgi:membrane-associated phospholipid phosphatase